MAENKLTKRIAFIFLFLLGIVWKNDHSGIHYGLLTLWMEPKSL